MFQRLGAMEIGLIVVVALLIFGPSKLPQLGRSIGDTMREFKKSMKSVTDEVTETTKEVEAAVKEPEKKA